MRTDKKPPQKADKKTPFRAPKRGLVGYSKKSALLEDAITQMNAGKYGRSSAALKELLTLDPHNTEARRLFATLHLRLGSLVTARQAFESLANEAIGRQDFWLAESLLREYLAAGPRCVPFLELLAHVYEEKGDTMAAVAELGKAIDILIEDPIPENPKKPSELYAKVRAIEPASPVALQFASLFDIQTGELLAPHPSALPPATSLEVATSQPQDDALAATEVREASDVIPRELFDGAPLSHEDQSSTRVNSFIEPSDVSSEPALSNLTLQGLEASPAESEGAPQAVSSLDQDRAPSMPEQSSLESEPAPVSIVAAPPSSSAESREDMSTDLTVASPSFAEEGLAPSSPESIPEERSVDVGIIATSTVGSSGLSSPMPWEQIEDSTIKIVEGAVPAPAPFAQSEEAPVGAESVVDQLASPAPVPELSELTLAVDQPVSPAALPEPEAPTPSAAESSPSAPFSWNAVFDGAWKAAAGTASSNSPAVLSNPDAISQNAKDVESVQPVSVPEPERSAPGSTVIPEVQSLSSDPEPLPSAPLSILREETESISETDSIGETDQSGSAAVLISEEPSRADELATLSRKVADVPAADLPITPVPEPVELKIQAESVSASSVEAMQPAAVLAETLAPALSDCAVAPEAPPAPEPISVVHHEIPITPLQSSVAPQPSATLGDDTPSAFSGETDAPAHWSTGEVAVQTHRPSAKKQNWDKEKGEATVVPPTPLPLAEEFSEPVAELLGSGGWEPAPSASPVVEAAAPVVEKAAPLQEDTRPDWAQASDSITFVKFNPLPPPTEISSGIEATSSQAEPVAAVTASAVDVLFDSTGQKNQAHTQDRVVLPSSRPFLMARARIGISSFLGSCFSTTQSIAMLGVALGLACAALVVVGIGAVGLTWLVMEEPPTPAYQNLTTSSPQSQTDPRKNGYFLLLGFEALADRDPLQAGYERRMETSDLEAANACMVGEERKGVTTAGASANVVRGWFGSADPMAQLRGKTETVRSWATQESIALRRYQRWLSMPFDDVGYGQLVSPNCSHILLAHRLYLAEGFSQDLSAGLDRLETDMGSWRVALGQSKTLMVKMLAATAIEDDIAIASGLLLRQDLDGTSIGRLGKIVRPLDQVELSVRWPMQSQFLWATKAVKSSLKNDKANERPLYVALAAAMSLPVQRRSNAYADYYETANKAVAEGRYTNLPKLSSFIRTPAVSMLDYLANPIEHIIGIEPLPSWDPYVGRIVEIDARLRLAGLQAWIRRGTQEGNVLTRLAKAGQAHYDPFTGLPMLVNQQKGVMYSVGRDGKDQDGDPKRDVVVTIPSILPAMTESPRAAAIH